jgi:hypothetical protein
MQSEHITLPQEAGSIPSPLIGNSFSEIQRQSIFADMKYELEKLFGRDRKLVFVGHGTGRDISVLKLLGVDLETSIVGYFDTSTVAWDVHSKPIRFCATKAGSLETLVKY